MAGYRRLISYIYAYEGEIKGKNIGFAKLEVKNGQCRLSISVKKVYVGSSDLGVYLLAPGKELLLGTMFIRGGAGEFRAIIDTENAADSGYAMESCYGLTLHEKEDNWRSYTTIWEDAVAKSAQVELAEVTSENCTDKDEQLYKKVEEINREIEQAEKQSFEESLNKEEKQEREEGVFSEEKKEKDGSETVMKDPQESEMSETMGEERETETDGVKEEELVPGNREKLERLEEEERLRANHKALWEQFRSHYPKIQAFDSAGGVEILTIHPQDIGLLPRENWGYGNNSFLLHGFYNYRYLVLARVGDENKGKVRYILGVPGHYYSNEKYMASMFGFPHFVLSKNQPSEDGRFGYWYTDIRMEIQD